MIVVFLLVLRKFQNSFSIENLRPTTCDQFVNVQCINRTFYFLILYIPLWLAPAKCFDFQKKKKKTPKFTILKLQYDLISKKPTVCGRVKKLLTSLYTYLTHFNPILNFLYNLVIWFAVQLKWLVSTWNITLG